MNIHSYSCGRTDFSQICNCGTTVNSEKLTPQSVLAWKISIPYIERVNRTGVQSIYTSNLYSSSLDGELVQDTATTFIPRTEQGAYRLYTFINNTWTIVDKDGLTYKLGYSSSTQVYDPAQPTHTAMWMLEEQRDTNNNFISYGYVKDSNQIYPDVITYTGSGSTAGAHQVTFLREARGDTLTAYDKGFAATTSYRISAIKAWADGALVRTPHLWHGK